MEIRIKKRSQNENITLFIFIMPFLFALLFEALKLSSFIKYTVDFAWIFIFITMVFKKKRMVSTNVRFLRRYVFIFFTFCIINYMFHYQSLLYLLWGIRNNFRFYVFFFACIYYFDKNTVDKMLQFLNKLFYVHMAVLFFQCFVWGIKRDNLGGIFGVQNGCNAWLNIFDVIIVAYSVIEYLNNRCSIKKTVLNCGLTLVAAAMAELKFFYVEFLIIIVVSILITNFTVKKFAIVMGTVIGLVISIKFLIAIFPEWSNSMSIQKLFAIAASDKGYTSSGDMNRLTFFKMSKNIFIQNNISSIFGFGLGNCDYSNVLTILNTPFYLQYNLTHYTWLSLAFMYLENGLIGLIFYIGFFVITLIHSCSYIKTNKEIKNYLQFTIIISIMCLSISMYNVSLRMECAYMLYFILAIPYILIKPLKS